MKTNRLSGGEALLGQIMANGVDTIFGLPGVQLDPFFDAMYKAGNELRFYGSRHEQGAAYMAYGYARSTGKPGVYAVVPGPGVLNSTAALCTAYAAGAPVMCLTGQIPTIGLGKGIGYLHELPDQLGTMRSLTKWADRAMTPQGAPGLVNEAFRNMLSGRQRPVSLEMPMDTMAEAADVALLPAATLDVAPTLDGDAVERAARLLGSAKRPLIVAGGGALPAGEAVERLASFLQAPVVSFRNARGLISDRSYLAHFLPGGHALWKDADVILGIGSRMEQQYLRWGIGNHQSVVRIDIDADELTRVNAPEVALHADSAVAVEALLQTLERISAPKTSREIELSEAKAVLRRQMEQSIRPQIAFLDAIRRALPDDGFFVDEVTQMGYASWVAFPVTRPRQLVTAGYQGTLGYGYATALGVQAAHPDKAVVNIVGDGGFLFTANEMATAAAYDLPLVTILFNNNKYENVQRLQKEGFDGRIIASDLKNPDFMKLAESFGIRAERADSPDMLESAIKTGLERRAPCLIEVPVRDVPTPWPYIMRPPVFTEGRHFG